MASLPAFSLHLHLELQRVCKVEGCRRHLDAHSVWVRERRHRQLLQLECAVWVAQRLRGLAQLLADQRLVRAG